MNQLTIRSGSPHNDEITVTVTHHQPDIEPNSYDQLPYHSVPFYAVHPDRLATAAVLYNLEPPPVDNCRVLELGCGTGSNLIPMAAALPNARFVGIDLSRRQIDIGNRELEALQLRNCELRFQSILDVDASLGSFDYILCHGVYSWVPELVRDKILDICHSLLVENGIAYISYNVLPGWHFKGLVRDFMKYHTRALHDPTTRVRAARDYLDFLASSMPESTDIEPQLLQSLLQARAKAMRQEVDTYVFHEYLEEENAPVYFHQFAAHLQAKGLVYLTDSEVDSLTIGQFSPQMRDNLRTMADDRIDLEQQMDYLRCRMFRRSLICRQNMRPAEQMQPERLRQLQLTAALTPVEENPDLLSEDVAVDFRGPGRTSLTSTSAVIKLAAAILGEVWPETISFHQLLSRMEARLQKPLIPYLQPDGSKSLDYTAILADALSRAYVTQVIDLHFHVPPFSPRAGDKPVGSPYARRQATLGTELLTNLRHRSVRLNELDRMVLRHLDGDHDRDRLRAVLLQQAQNHEFEVRRDGEPLRDPTEASAALESALEPTLERLANNVLLLR